MRDASEMSSQGFLKPFPGMSRTKHIANSIEFYKTLGNDVTDTNEKFS